MEAYDRLMLPENLTYAWLKAKNLYRTDDGYIDNGELAEFELDLEQRLAKIRQRFKRGSYRLKSLRPLPRPKKIKDSNPIYRQYYHVSVDDQVAWIAIANVLGPELDRRMPTWSYGNRIYRPAWYRENETRQSVLEIGPYRHASGHLYRKFQHSWPLFRRQIGLTARAMARAMPPDIDELDQADRWAAEIAYKEKLPYLKPNFWNPERHKGSSDRSELYHASIDLKQFFPSVHAGVVLHGLTSTKVIIDDRMEQLVASMLRFRLDKSEIPPEIFEHVEPSFDGVVVDGIPTGLFVAGFLANVAMLQVDADVDNRVRNQRSVAHFRFVDDHAILAYEFEDLCEWIEWYQARLQAVGATVHPEKFNPGSLGEWINERIQDTKPDTSPMVQTALTGDRKENVAMQETRLDGRSPIKLLTKTLGQVSAIAATNFDILDDEDLEEQLRLLEWLLLADIPEHEIRPDTRAAFAAGRIATLAPMLSRDPDGLIDTARSVADLKAKALNLGHATEAEIEIYKREIGELENRLTELQKERNQTEERHLRHCFDLLLQAFRKFPGKARLFRRLLDYCRISGFQGLSEIVDWIEEVRKQDHEVWANYYAGLMLQILARGLFIACRDWRSGDVLRSKKDVVLLHLEDITNINLEKLLLLHSNEAWFHAIGRKEFGIAALSASEIFCQVPIVGNLGEKLKNIARKCLNSSFNDSAQHWEKETARSPGVWAHLVECFLGSEDEPSPVWNRFELLFSFSYKADICALRRYPESLSDTNWDQLFRSKKAPPVNDSGWLREVIHGNKERINAALRSDKIAFRCAASSINLKPLNKITLDDWTKFIFDNCSPFDPRRNEWTALEIMQQIVDSVIQKYSIDQAILRCLHPTNILIPKDWEEEFACQYDRAGASWEEWRECTKTYKIELTKPRNLRISVIRDYRYSTDTVSGDSFSNWQRFLVGIGRLLLGQLRFDHGAQRIWNIRGNEKIFPLPRTHWFQALAISSPTLLLVESCLSGRSTETRVLVKIPELFGWTKDRGVNDIEFDPPVLHDADSLLNAIEQAQEVLEKNQLSVLMNQPRQLIPFRLSDFSAGPNHQDEGESANE